MKQFLGKVKFWMDKFLSIACAVLLSFMTILVLIQVFSRYVLNSPVAFTEELVRYSLIWTGFIGAAYAFSTREHMSLTLVRDKFTGKAHTALLVAIDGLILLDLATDAVAPGAAGHQAGEEIRSKSGHVTILQWLNWG